MKKIRFRFCPTLKKKVSYVDEYEVLTNGNGRDKAMVRILTGICFPSHRRTEHLSLN